MLNTRPRWPPSFSSATAYQEENCCAPPIPTQKTRTHLDASNWTAHRPPGAQKWTAPVARFSSEAASGDFRRQQQEVRRRRAVPLVLRVDRGRVSASRFSQPGLMRFEKTRLHRGSRCHGHSGRKRQPLPQRLSPRPSSLSVADPYFRASRRGIVPLVVELASGGLPVSAPRSSILRHVSNRTVRRGSAGPVRPGQRPGSAGRGNPAPRRQRGSVSTSALATQR